MEKLANLKQLREGESTHLFVMQRFLHMKKL